MCSSVYVYSRSVIVITVRYSTSLPSPLKPAPEIFGGRQSMSEVPAEVRLVRQHTLGGGWPLPVYLRFDPTKGYRLRALVAQAVTPTVGTRPYGVTTVTPSRVTHHLAPLKCGIEALRRNLKKSIGVHKYVLTCIQIVSIHNLRSTPVCKQYK